MSDTRPNNWLSRHHGAGDAVGLDQAALIFLADQSTRHGLVQALGLVLDVLHAGRLPIPCAQDTRSFRAGRNARLLVVAVDRVVVAIAALDDPAVVMGNALDGAGRRLEQKSFCKIKGAIKQNFLQSGDSWGEMLLGHWELGGFQAHQSARSRFLGRWPVTRSGGGEAAALNRGGLSNLSLMA